jgi:hypothetical protein
MAAMPRRSSTRRRAPWSPVGGRRSPSASPLFATEPSPAEPSRGAVPWVLPSVPLEVEDDRRESSSRVHLCNFALKNNSVGKRNKPGVPLVSWYKAVDMSWIKNKSFMNSSFSQFLGLIQI